MESFASIVNFFISVVILVIILDYRRTIRRLREELSEAWETIRNSDKAIEGASRRLRGVNDQIRALNEEE